MASVALASASACGGPSPGRQTPPPPPAAASVPALSPLPVPYQARGACPFECCTYGRWTVERPTPVLSAMAAEAAPAFELRRGQRVDALTGVVVVHRPGRARVLRDVTFDDFSLRAGEEVAVLHPQGEGFFAVWRQGRMGSVEIGGAPPPGSRGPAVEMVERPGFVWWVQVRDERGRIGWTDRPENFGGKDACA